MGRGSPFGVDWFHGDCGALLFSKAGEELEDCNQHASGMFPNVKSLHDFLGHMVPNGTKGILESLERDGAWSAKDCGGCGVGGSSRHLSIWRLSNPLADDEGSLLVLLKGCGGNGKEISSQVEKAPWVQTGAAEDRLREQLQTLQRKLLNLVAENEALSTRLTGLRSVCLELKEQLISEEIDMHVDPGMQQHLLHLCNTAASYCEVEPCAVALARSGSMGKLQDLDDDLADFQIPEGVLESNCTTGLSTAAAEVAVAAAAAAAATACFTFPDAVDQAAATTSGKPASGAMEASDIKAPGANIVAAMSSEPDYASLMESFIMLKASYDVILQQQDMTAGPTLLAHMATANGDTASAGALAPALGPHSRHHVSAATCFQPNGQSASVAQLEALPGILSQCIDGLVGTSALSADCRADSSICDEISDVRPTDMEMERLAAHARALKASFDVMQMQRDQALSQGAAQKAQFDKSLEAAKQEAVQAVEIATAAKAQFDKFVLDKAEEKAAYDLVLEKTVADVAAQKAIADKALVDFGELQESATAAKAQFDKFVLDKVEEKAAFDLVLEKTVADVAAQKAIADKALVDFGELQVSATAAKAQFDKFVLDKAEEKAAFDLVLEKTVADAAAQKAIADKVLTDMDEMQESAVAAKAQFDKFVLDKTEEKAAFDLVLEKTVAAAAAQKAIADKALVDFGELQESATAAKAQFDKFVLDKVEEKAAFDLVLEKTVADVAAQKAIADKALVDVGELQESAVAAKAQFDKFMLDKTEEKAAYDLVLEKTVADAAAQKAIADKALTDFGELQESATAAKAQFDKFVLDKVEEKAAFDLVLEKTVADVAAQKAIADKALVDVGELQECAVAAKAQFDKFVLDKVEEKAAFDLVLEQTAADAAAQKAIADKALVDFGELQESATAAKAHFDKFVLDKTEEKAAFDLVLEKTVADVAAQKAIADKALVDVGELQELATAAKAQFDKFVLDKVEEKAAFDLVLEQTVADAAAQKAIADKALTDFGELQESSAATKAQFDKFVLDKVEEKAAYDLVLEKTVADATAQKALADKALVDFSEQKAIADKALVDYCDLQETANATKAQFDKFVIDKVEEKATFDRMLEVAEAQAVQQKAIADKALVDMGEMQTSAATTKAQFDKFVLDKAEEKAILDRALEQAACEAAQHKAVADKTLVDFSELQESAAANKAQFDKFVLDKVEEKASFDKAYEESIASACKHKALADKALVDLSELQASADANKAQFDKFVEDKAEEKAAFDLVLEKTVAEAAQHKAVADKVMVDREEMQHEVEASRAQVEKLLQDRAEEKATYDAELEKAAAEAKAQKDLADALKAEATSVAAQLAVERQTLDDLQAQNERLLKQHEVLQAELQMALSNYSPKAIIDAGTPADKILSMMTDLLDGSPPSIQDILLVQSAILEAHDIYQPINLGKQLLQSSALDNDVGMALLQQLGNGDEARALTNGPELTLRDFGTRDSSNGRSMRSGKGMGSPTSSSSSLMDVANGDAVWSTLESAITALMAPDGEFADPSRENAVGSTGSNGDARAVSSFSRGLHARVRSQKGCQPDGRGCSSTKVALFLDRALTSGSLALEGEDEFPESPLFSEVERLLATANNWQFDVFKLADATQDHALSTLSFYLFHQADLMRKFDIKPQLLARFMRRVEEGYRPNPYHSKTHAADVLQTLHVIIHRGGLAPGYVDPLTLMACYLAALVHDYEHGGLTNDYLINSSDLLALRYNDRAPLENHHLAAAFTLLKKPEYAFMSHLPKADTDRLRKMVIELVLATDMKQHFAIMSHFTTVHRLGAANSVTPSLLSGTERRRSSSNASSINSLAQGGSGCPVEIDKIVIPLDENERILSLQMALKCSDLGHVSASLPVHCRWVQLLEEEFFRQGDMEKQHSLPVSPLFDRCKPGITKSQIGFFDIVVIPLLNCFSRVFSNTKPLLTYTMRNYKYWAEQQKLEQLAANGVSRHGK
ncbi:hypothetical protein Vafri_16725 [Volvox africanus]|uniref:Phosphodiesterase n=1 Tax=Volvox africanus TaxID=51714 RepID=A0A8J4BIQ9_9CHLO|nr:hypothetical protein Vafri_16725 [Volvox africanus]